MSTPVTLETISQANLAQTLHEILPSAELITSTELPDHPPGLHVFHVAVPKGTDVREFTVDLEKHLPAPRSTHATALMGDVDSFLAYVARHADERSVVWCQFDPQTYALNFTAVIDEHARGGAGWRRHKASFTPTLSHEWMTWTKHAGTNAAKEQLEFAEFLERNEGDIAAAEGLPSSAEMMKMATNFEVTSEKRLRSSVRLQSGAIQLEYIDKEDEATVQQMRLFERFAIGIPVFRRGVGYRLDARLKHRVSQGKAKFWFELIRPDRVHEAAALELVDRVRTGIGQTPLLLGACS